jgi:flavin-dependent dehydrogenase
MQKSFHDVVVVGARPAGAAAAMLLARRGLDVLVVDRAEPGRDTLSTHALMRAGVLQLRRWGLLDAVVDAGTPPVRRTSFHYDDGTLAMSLKPAAGVDALYAPRRTLLDRLLVDAAGDAGATLRFGTTVHAVVKDGAARVTGIRGRDRNGDEFVAHAALTIGADGLNSLIARQVDAPFERIGPHASACVYAYWPHLDADGYEWFWRAGTMIGLIPTNDNEVCVCVAAPLERLWATGYRTLLDRIAPEVAARSTSLHTPNRLRRFRGASGYLRRATGPGWALVGDAGYYKDPLSAHGITDALRDAELLARAVVDGALADYQRERDRLSIRHFEIVDELAAFAWDSERVRDLLLALSASMTDEVEALSSLDRAPLPTIRT